MVLCAKLAGWVMIKTKQTISFLAINATYTQRGQSRDQSELLATRKVPALQSKNGRRKVLHTPVAPGHFLEESVAQWELKAREHQGHRNYIKLQAGSWGALIGPQFQRKKEKSAANIAVENIPSSIRRRCSRTTSTAAVEELGGSVWWVLQGSCPLDTRERQWCARGWKRLMAVTSKWGANVS